MPVAVSDILLSRLKDILGPKGWADAPEVVAARTTDWRGRYAGATPLLARPSSAEEVSGVVEACAEAGVAITPQGGNTSLCGGATPEGEILLSLDRMRGVRRIDALNDSLTVDAGAVLADVHAAAADVDRLFPLTLGSQGSATIGGLASTNAGGVHVLRYGMMRDLVLGLEAVMPDGRIWDGLSGLRKDNTGYDLKQLLIGAEGTLGVITAATLKLFPRLAGVAVAIAGVPSPKEAVALLRRAQEISGGAVSAFELLPKPALDLVLAHIPGTRPPLAQSFAWNVLIEIGVADSAAAAPLLQRILETGLGDGLVLDAVVASNEAQAAAFWKLRETIAEAEKQHAVAIKHDVSVPTPDLPAFIAEASAAALRVAPGGEIIAFGHVGDGNVHFNVSKPASLSADAFLALQDDVQRAVHDVVASFGGSISAEHGIGILKRRELAARKSGVELDAMRAIKQALDPRNIMNPRVLFLPAEP